MSYLKEIYTLSDFDFVLPNELIAQTPVDNRVMSRLLQVNSDLSFNDKYFIDIIDDFKSGDVLIVNNTKVVPARLHGQKLSGGKLEIFVERISSYKQALCMIKSNHSPKVGDIILLGNHGEFVQAQIVEHKDMFFLIKLLQNDWHNLLNTIGDIPLPPYINRKPTEKDLERYQTVYAKHAGAVAAPTAGLHFNNELLDKLQEKGVQIVYITLHVGAGTFLPIKTENINEHVMHFELFEVPQRTADIINSAKVAGNCIVAVGTTSLRAVESANKDGLLIAKTGDTNLFITPGYNFQIVDRLITNFHLPKSSLMMLVSAFAGYNEIMTTYQYAISKKYRFFSYGDAMLLAKKNHIN